MLTVIKRDGKREAFNSDKIINAILAAGSVSGQNISYEFCEQVANFIGGFPGEDLTISQIQNIVEENLMKSKYENTARRYIIYRDLRDKEREKENKKLKTFNEIIDVANNSVNRENANINAATPAGMMMKFASEVSKEYALDYLLNPEHAKLHKEGCMHLHDLDYYSTGSTTCTQCDLLAILKNGFNTNDGPVREPKSVRTASSLAAIVLQSSQNEQHGGQSFPAFEYAMAEYVRKSFVNNFIEAYEFLYETIFDLAKKDIYIDNINLKMSYNKVYNKALKATQEETRQAMESFIHNMNNMHSRGKQICLAV